MATAHVATIVIVVIASSTIVFVCCNCCCFSFNCFLLSFLQIVQRCQHFFHNFYDLRVIVYLLQLIVLCISNACLILESSCNGMFWWILWYNSVFLGLCVVIKVRLLQASRPFYVFHKSWILIALVRSVLYSNNC